MQIITLFILFVWGVIDHLNPRDKKGLNQQIKYDLRDRKLSFITAVIFTGLSILIMIMLALPDSIWGDFGQVMDLGVLVLVFGGPLVIGLWACYLDCFFYLKRLHRHGYEIPKRKKDYDKRLSQLQRTVGETKGITKESVVLAVFCWINAVGLSMMAIAFWWKYQTIQDMVIFCMVVFGVLVVCWIIFGMCYWRQRINSRFRDDVEPETERKLRVSIVSGLGFIVFMLFVCNIGIVIMDQGMKSVIYFREQTYQEEQNLSYNEGKWT